ncbi:hypothetical protein ACTFIW_000990 [Dictyostelium discoideum]
MIKRKFFQTNLPKDLISHKLESGNCEPFIFTANHGNNMTSIRIIIVFIISMLIKEVYTICVEDPNSSSKERKNLIEFCPFRQLTSCKKYSSAGALDNHVTVSKHPFYNFISEKSVILNSKLTSYLEYQLPEQLPPDIHEHIKAI